MLRGRWFYMLLGAVVLLAYVRMFTLIPHQLAPELEEQVMSRTVPTRDLSTIELDPARLLAASRRHPVLARVLGWALLLALSLGAAGVWLTVRALWTGRLRTLLRYRSKLPAAWSFKELGRMALLMVCLIGLAPFVHLSLMAWGVAGLADKHLWSVVFMLGLEGLFLLIVWGFASTKQLTLSSAFGVSWRKAPGAIGQGVLGYAAVFPWIMGLLWLIATICQWVGLEPPVEPIHELLFLEQRPLVLALTLLLACVVGPVAEEVLFRGVLFAALRSRTSRLWAMVASGSLFAVVHTNPVGFVPILLLGCVLADLYERTGSLLASIAVHILHNTLLIGLGLTVKQLLTS